MFLCNYYYSYIHVYLFRGLTGNGNDINNILFDMEHCQLKQ